MLPSASIMAATRVLYLVCTAGLARSANCGLDSGKRAIDWLPDRQPLLLRSGRDSNPRDVCTPGCFQGSCNQPDSATAPGRYAAGRLTGQRPCGHFLTKYRNRLRQGYTASCPAAWHTGGAAGGHYYGE
jgi:hypothetical protein